MITEESGSLVCRPLTSLDDLLEWKRPNQALSSTITIPRFDTHAYAKRIQNCVTFQDIQPYHTNSQYEVRHRSSSSRLAICHDMKGGYLEDRFINGSKDSSAYNFVHWHLIDEFIYFAHALVTVPPPGWTTVCHRNSVRCFGTFITEFTEGSETWKAIFKLSEDDRDALLDKLVDIADYFGFDGYLMNIENPIENKHMTSLMDLLRKLRSKLHDRVGSYAELMLYDSLTEKGSLDWQNSLTAVNICFAREACFDTFYLNYTWSVPREFDETERQLTKVNAERTCAVTKPSPRYEDKCVIGRESVYFGVDVFGRGSYGGGQIGTFRAVKEITKRDYSVALFAPGWLYETFERADAPKNAVLKSSFARLQRIESVSSAHREAVLSRFRSYAQRILSGCSSRPLRADRNSQWVADFYERDELFWETLFNETCSVTLKPICTPFRTQFQRGFGSSRFCDGNRSSVDEDANWFNLAEQQILPSFTTRFARVADPSRFTCNLQLYNNAPAFRVRNLAMRFDQQAVLNGSWSLALNFDVHVRGASTPVVSDTNVLHVVAEYPLFFVHLPLASLHGQVTLTCACLSNDLVQSLSDASVKAMANDNAIRLLLLVDFEDQPQLSSDGTSRKVVRSVCFAEENQETLSTAGSIIWRRVRFDVKALPADCAKYSTIRKLSLLASISSPVASRHCKVLIDEFCIE